MSSDRIENLLMLSVWPKEMPLVKIKNCGVWVREATSLQTVWSVLPLVCPISVKLCTYMLRDRLSKFLETYLINGRSRVLCALNVLLIFDFFVRSSWKLARVFLVTLKGALKNFLQKGEGVTSPHPKILTIPVNMSDWVFIELNLCTQTSWSSVKISFWKLGSGRGGRDCPLFFPFKVRWSWQFTYTFPVLPWRQLSFCRPTKR